MVARFVLAQIYLISIISYNSYATIIHVPGDYPTIQAAVDAAMYGDEVVLADGVFSGQGNFNIDMLGKTITVRSQSGDPDACIIDVPGEYNQVAQRGFYLGNNEGRNTVIRDLTIMNGVADAP
ncbi:MAG: hypothetical protein JSW64_12200 [Candidatus Zixiibacteriota bacterium]|nr:MAG: hypothetical protein JSW64_12200 [candidate division Zixibacteria bacterium]